MDRQNLQPGELDKIGSELILSTVLSESEVERIAESPFLYSGVKARIELPSPRPAFGFSRRFAFGFASLFVVIGIAAAGIVFLRSENTLISARQTPKQPVRDSKPVAADVVNSVPEVVIAPQRRASPQFQNASYRKTDDRVVTKRKSVPERVPDLEFYSLTFAGDPNEVASGGRVLQVEMSRSSLFAMGFNVPIENGAEVVKADLLVGPDGVPRAIRVH